MIPTFLKGTLMQRIVVDFKNLPLVVEVRGENGETKFYQLKPAGKDKLGACLAGLESTLLEKMLRAQAK